MIITNKCGLPETFVDMATQDWVTKENVYRVTTLLKSPREILLNRRHEKEIEQDVSNMIWMLFGTAVHGVLENCKEGDSQFKEERLEMKFGDYTMSGKFDLYDADKKKIIDYKTCSVYKVCNKDYTDWKQQLLMYSTMLVNLGFPVECGEIVAIMKDHSKLKSKIDRTYPKFPVQVIPFKFTKKDFENASKFITDKFEEIKKYENVPDDELPICSAEDRYNTGDKFAVMEKKKKRALRVLDTEEEANTWMKNNKGDYIEKRIGEDKKCKEYCQCNQFCNYYLSHYKGVDKTK